MNIQRKYFLSQLFDAADIEKEGKIPAGVKRKLLGAEMKGETFKRVESRSG